MWQSKAGVWPAKGEKDMSMYLMRQFSKDSGSVPNLAAWFPKLPEHETDRAINVLQALEHTILAPRGCALQRTPTGTGAALLLHMIPEQKHGNTQPRYYEIPDGYQTTIRAGLAHASIQFFRSSDQVEQIVYYDARAAYLSRCGWVPCYFGGDDELVVDERNEYAINRGHRGVIGFYLCDVKVPHDWRHIGLAPQKIPGQRYAAFPHKPGCEWETWLDGCEVAQLIKHGWQCEIKKRILFPTAQTMKYNPLANWADLLCREIEEIGDHPHERQGRTVEGQKLMRAAIRAMGLHTIGFFHSHGAEQTKILRKGEKVPPEIPLWAAAKLNEDQSRTYTWKEAHKDKRRMWNHPEWQAHILAKWRVYLHAIAVQLPFDDILAIQTDAIYLRQWGDRAIFGADTGKCGQFRVKANPMFPGGMPAPATFGELNKLITPATYTPEQIAENRRQIGIIR